MKYAIHLFTVLFFFAGVSSRAGEFSLPDIPDGEIRSYKGFTQDEKDRSDEDGKLLEELATYTDEIHWEGQGDGRRMVLTRKSSFKKGSRVEKFTFVTSPEFRLKSFENQRFAPDGRKITEEFFNFTNPLLQYPADVLPISAWSIAVRCNELWVGKEIFYNLWVSSTSVYTARFRVLGEETITTPAGTFECYKLSGELVAKDLSDLIGVLISLVVGKVYFWVEKDAAHGFVRIRIPISIALIPGTARYRTEELVEFHPGKRSGP